MLWLAICVSRELFGASPVSFSFAGQEPASFCLTLPTVTLREMARSFRVPRSWLCYVLNPSQTERVNVLV